MKRIIACFLLTITALNFISCDDNNPNEGKFNSNPEMGWVTFGTFQPYTLPAACGNIAVPIQLEGVLDYNGPVNKNGIDIHYTITDVEGSTAGMIAYATIPAGSRQGSFVITNSEIFTSNVEFDLTLTSTNNENVAAGKLGATSSETITVRIVGGSARYVGNYDVLETSSAGPYEYSSSVSVGTAENELILGNIYDSDSSSETKVFVNADGTLSFPAYMDNYLFTATINNLPTPLYFEGISGTANACSGGIEVTFNLRTATGQLAAGPVKVVMTK